MNAFERYVQHEIEAIINKLFEIANHKNYTIKELAEMFHVEPKTITRWKKRKHLPRQVYVPMIKKFIQLEEQYKVEFQKS